jgi:hypothetical protein
MPTETVHGCGNIVQERNEAVSSIQFVLRSAPLASGRDVRIIARHQFRDVLLCTTLAQFPT